MIYGVLYWLARGLIALIQALPLGLVARLGRGAGELAYWIDARHRRVALENLRLGFRDEKSPAEQRALAHENFRRLGENYLCAIKTAGMSAAEISKVLEVRGLEHSLQPDARGAVFAIGHFGNFELYARVESWLGTNFRRITTYRGLPDRRLNELLLSLRAQSGATFFERRNQGAELKRTLEEGNVILGLLCDQAVRRGGVPTRFFGRNCSTSTAPAVFAQRYDLALHDAICFRVAPGRWRIDVGPSIRTAEADGSRRPILEIMDEVNARFERAIRVDPANWFWVHRRWKTGHPSRRHVTPVSAVTAGEENSDP